MRPQMLPRQQSVALLDTAREQLCRNSTYERKRKLSKRLRTKARLAALLDAAGRPALASSVRFCCAFYAALRCGNGHAHRVTPTHRCGYGLCVDCARRRASRAFARLLPIVEGFMRAYQHDRLVLVTLTVRSSFEHLETHHHALKRHFRNFRRTKHWRHRIRGGIAGFEPTYNDAHGWHYHLHALCLRKVYYSKEELAADWRKATKGEGFIVDIKEVTDVRSGLVETLKYIFKPANLEAWNVDQVREFNDLTMYPDGRKRNIRFSESFGEMYGLKVESDEDDELAPEEAALDIGSPCPDCGESLDAVYLTREEFEAARTADVLIRVRGKPETVH